MTRLEEQTSEEYLAALIHQEVTCVDSTDYFLVVISVGEDGKWIRG